MAPSRSAKTASLSRREPSGADGPHGYRQLQAVGRGPGNSKLRDSLSQAYSDYLYAIIIEEYGILGLLFIPSLYLVWMLIGYREARKQTNVFRSNLIKGFGILYPLQALVNMIVASGIITTGRRSRSSAMGGLRSWQQVWPSAS